MSRAPLPPDPESRYRAFPADAPELSPQITATALESALSWPLPDVTDRLVHHTPQSLPRPRKASIQSILTGTRGVGFVLVIYTPAPAGPSYVHAVGKSRRLKTLRRHRDNAIELLREIDARRAAQDPQAHD